MMHVEPKVCQHWKPVTEPIKKEQMYFFTLNLIFNVKSNRFKKEF